VTSRANDRENGFTLIELLIAMSLSVVIVATLTTSLQLVFKTAVGLSPTAAAGAQNKDLLFEQTLAHVGVQEFSRLFTGDVENTVRASDIAVSGIASPACSIAGGDPSLSPGTDTPLVRLTYVIASTTMRIDYRYSRDALQQHAQIARYACPPSGSGTARVIAQGLSSASVPSAAIKSGAAGRRTVTASFTTVASRVYSFTASQRLDLDTEPAPPSGVIVPAALPDTATDLRMVDDSPIDGRPDGVVITLANGAAACSSGWTLSNIPAGGIQATTSVVASSGDTQLRIGITETTSGYDTSVGAGATRFAVSFSPPTGCSVAIPDNDPISDGAGPVLVGLVAGAQPALGTAGKIEFGDALSMKFSEPLDSAGVPSSVSITETGGNPGNSNTPNIPDNLQITSATGAAITNGAVDLGLPSESTAVKKYVTGTGKQPRFTGSVTPGGTPLVPDYSKLVISVTSGCLASTGDCNAIGTGAGTPRFSLASNLKDAAGNTAVPAATVMDMTTTPPVAVGPTWKTF
jgi:prepilin-type N-terminal cleavage/methylation domain-containing protein